MAFSEPDSHYIKGSVMNIVLKRREEIHLRCDSTIAFKHEFPLINVRSCCSRISGILSFHIFTPRSISIDPDPQVNYEYEPFRNSVEPFVLRAVIFPEIQE